METPAAPLRTLGHQERLRGRRAGGLAPVGSHIISRELMHNETGHRFRQATRRRRSKSDHFARAIDVGRYHVEAVPCAVLEMRGTQLPRAKVDVVWRLSTHERKMKL